MKTTTILIWMILLIAVVVLFVLARLPQPADAISSSPATSSDSSSWFKSLSDSWVARLAVNLLGYSIIIIPGLIIKRLVHKRNYLDHTGDGCTRNLIRLCFYGDQQLVPSEAADTVTVKAERSATRQLWLVLFCFFGLQGSYLVWGLLQERIMTIDYTNEAGKTSERFRDSQFLVFVNRILAFVLSGAYLLWARQPRHKAPIYKYSFCSFSNIMSSWCQYEALKYVNFPIQVLAKASKIIPVMLMGKIVSRKSYDYYEYVSAIIISVGMTLFLFGSEENTGAKGEPKDDGSFTMFSGIIILAGYMMFDSFTSNWQSELFKQHSMTFMQMMCGVNLFSVLFTTVSLLQQGGFIQSWDFMWRHPAFVFDIVILSLTSATGQLFIFYTISQFGAVVFTIMMTIRQLLAIILSCIIYHHPITILGVLGIILVFGAIFLRIYCGQRKQHLARVHKVPTSHKV